MSRRKSSKFVPQLVSVKLETLTKAISYQHLALEARDVWLDWNNRIDKSTPAELPPPLTPEDKLFEVCGLYHLSDGRHLLPRYQKYLDTMARLRPDIRDRQFIAGNAEERKRLKDLCPEFREKYHLFDQDRGGDWNGYLSTTDGVLWADKVGLWIIRSEDCR